MKKILSEWFWPVFVMTWILWPWAVGLTDLIAWVFTGTPVSSIPWGNDHRAGVMIFWPIAWVAICLGVVGLVG